VEVVLKLFEHQVETINFLAANDRAFITSDPGTGKTRCIIEHMRAEKNNGKALVFAPKSILFPSWAQDIIKFGPELTYRIADAKNRREAFEDDVDVVLVNHDAARWLKDNTEVLEPFNFICIDESTAFKKPTSQRSKAMARIVSFFEKRVLMTGTPNPNGIIDLWHQVKLVDDGKRLGTSYWKFRASTHTQNSQGPFTVWEEKEHIQEAVYGLMHDINIRHKFEDCIDIPENSVHTIKFELSPRHMREYQRLKTQAVLESQSGDVSAVNAAALATKLMQVASGSVYGDESVVQVAQERYELIMELIEEREQCLVAFNWTHQRDALIALSKKAGITYSVIDGSVSVADRNQAVADFQSGHTKVLFAHPASASHGLTLTKGTTTIWASPTYDAEKYQQFNRRIYRAGQTQKTETILVAGNRTIDVKAYQKLEAKVTKMSNLLELLED
jgi:SNF2 family DNA or RNA helicase